MARLTLLSLTSLTMHWTQSATKALSQRDEPGHEERRNLERRLRYNSHREYEGDCQHGVELSSLQNAAGCELLLQAGVEWPHHSPLLFAVVCRLKNDELRHRGKTFPMAQHGFARDQRVEWSHAEDIHCSSTLVPRLSSMTAQLIGASVTLQ